MAGQLWGTSTLGGYMYADQLSEVLRMELLPTTKFRQLADAKDFTDKGYHVGDTVHWNVYTRVATRGTTLTEGSTIPESNYLVKQGTATIDEFGNSVPYTGKLDDLSYHPVKEVVQNVLAIDAQEALDTQVWNKFNATKLRVVGTATAAPGIITLTTNGTATATSAADMTVHHVKTIVDTMKERNIPPYRGDDYASVARPTTYRNLRDNLESVYQHTEPGYGRIMRGEIGRYYGCRFVEQTFIAAAATGTWANGGDWAAFFGRDTVAEIIVRPEEIRGKIPTDYGRSKGIAWYAELGYSLVHTGAGDATGAVADARILMWDSGA